MALDEIRGAKIKKLELLKKAGIDSYPSKSWRTHKIGDVLAGFDALEKSKDRIVLAGRIMAKREHGGSVFLDIEDDSGKIQSYFKKDALGDHNFKIFEDSIDIGDFIEVYGLLFKTKKNEKTVEVEKYALLAKSLLPLPEKWHGLQDIEERIRKRYLDLLFNKNVKEKFRLRSRIIQEIRDFFIKRDFFEVETPILQAVAGGAIARPFKTHMNDLDIDLYLRVAPELYLKRLLVGGFEKIFEMGRNFRNEGMDREHNPEFTMLEAYAAYRDYEWMISLIEELFGNLVKNLFNASEAEINGKTVNFRAPFEKLEFNKLLEKHVAVDYDNASEEKLSRKAEELGVIIEKKTAKGVIADEIYKKIIRPEIIQPTFVINHPLEISPLAKRIKNNPDYVERFQLLVGGMEIANGFSELNDPLDQRERFEHQEKMRESGDHEAHRVDEDFIEALEYGMPPASGVGIGIDRVAALLTGSNTLREIILFPTMKPRGK